MFCIPCDNATDSWRFSDDAKYENITCYVYTRDCKGNVSLGYGTFMKSAVVGLTAQLMSCGSLFRKTGINCLS